MTRLLSAVIAALAILAIPVTGFFAWTTFSASVEDRGNMTWLIVLIAGITIVLVFASLSAFLSKIDQISIDTRLSREALERRLGPKP